MRNNNSFNLLNKEYSLQNQLTVALSVLSLAVYTVALCRYNAGEFSSYGYWNIIHMIPYTVLAICAVAVNYISKLRLCLFVSQFFNVIITILNLLFFGKGTYTNAYYETIRFLFFDKRYVHLSMVITMLFGIFALMSIYAGSRFWCRLYYSLNILFYIIMFIYMMFDENYVESDLAMSAAALLYNISHLAFSWKLKAKNETLAEDFKIFKHIFTKKLSANRKISVIVSSAALLMLAAGMVDLSIKPSFYITRLAYLPVIIMLMFLLISGFTANRKQALCIVQISLVVMELFDLILSDGFFTMSDSYFCHILGTVFPFHMSQVIVLMFILDMTAIFLICHCRQIWYSVYAGAKTLFSAFVLIKVFSFGNLTAFDVILSSGWLLFYIALLIVSFYNKKGKEKYD